jgi:hypothetical protein
MLFIPTFVHVVEWITYFTVTKPEIHFYEIADYKSVPRALTAKRGESKGREERARYRAQFHNDVRSWDIMKAYNSKGESCTCIACARIRLTLKSPEIVIVPTYEELTLVYFAKIRSVPMFPVGLLDLPYLLADGFEYSPYEFFVHDLFHTVGSDFGPPQLWQTINERVTELEKSRNSKEAIFKTWNENAQILLDTIRRAPNKHNVDALAVLLFVLLHEPFDRKELDDPINFSPALPERASIQSRLNDTQLMQKLKRKASEYFFGDLDPSVITAFDAARNQILGSLENLRKI